MPARKITRARCTICAHPERARIEFARISGASLDSIAATFGVHRDAVWRHCTKHVSDEQKSIYLADVPLEDLAKRANAENLSLLDYLVISRATLMSQMQAAAACNDRHGTATLAGRLNETLSLIGKLTGEMLALSPVNITNNTAVFMSSPLYLELEQMLIATLSDHPDVLAKVVGGLRQLEERTPIGNALPAPSMKDITPNATT
jgi:hypothetical protein